MGKQKLAIFLGDYAQILLDPSTMFYIIPHFHIFASIVLFHDFARILEQPPKDAIMIHELFRFWILIPWLLGITITSLVIVILLPIAMIMNPKSKAEQGSENDCVPFIFLISPALTGTLISLIFVIIYRQ